MELSAGYLLGLTRASTDRTNEARGPPPPRSDRHRRRHQRCCIKGWQRQRCGGKNIIKCTLRSLNGIGIKLNVDLNFPFLRGDRGDGGRGGGLHVERERRLIAILVLSPAFPAGAPCLHPALHYF